MTTVCKDCKQLFFFSLLLPRITNLFILTGLPRIVQTANQNVSNSSDELVFFFLAGPRTIKKKDINTWLSIENLVSLHMLVPKRIVVPTICKLLQKMDFYERGIFCSRVFSWTGRKVQSSWELWKNCAFRSLISNFVAERDFPNFLCTFILQVNFWTLFYFILPFSFYL